MRYGYTDTPIIPKSLVSSMPVDNWPSLYPPGTRLAKSHFESLRQIDTAAHLNYPWRVLARK